LKQQNIFITIAFITIAFITIVFKLCFRIYH
jgi:hypothetical protein